MYCRGLKAISVSPDNKKYDSRNNCNAIIHTELNRLIYGAANTKIPKTVVSIGVNAFRGNRLLSKIDIPESVISIGDVAFAGCTSLENIFIPQSITDIGMQAFNGCKSLNSIIVDEKNTVYDSRDSCNAIIKTSSNTLEYGCSKTIIPNSIKYIGGESFIYCVNLKYIEIPSSVVGIWGYAFKGCTNLESVIIGENVKTINDQVFYNCDNLKEITNYSIEPQLIKNTTFTTFNKLHVRKESYSKYMSTDVWSDFLIIDDAELCKIDSVSISIVSPTLCVGDSMRITANIYPQNASYKILKWSTSNANVVDVVDGVVNAKGSGSATITATTTDGTNLSASCDIAVKKIKQSITWNDELLLLQEGGEMVMLEAISSSGLPVKFISNDDNVVSIFDLGDVNYANPVKSGTAIITSYQEGNYKYEPAESKKIIEVAEAPRSATKTLIAYYSQSVLIDGIVAELANQIASSNVNVYTQKIEPTNDRINNANTDIEVMDSVMNIILHYPNEASSYPEIKNIHVNINDYDNIIMVYPLWNALMAAPMQTFNFNYKDILEKKSHAYIEYDLFDEADSSSNAKVLRFNSSNIEDMSNVIEDWLNNSEATGIMQLRKDRDGTAEGHYDLQGRRVTTVGDHGLYIIKGKKIIK